MATQEDIMFARRVVRDSLVTLRWAASEEGADDEGHPVVLPSLKPSLSGPVREVHDGPFELAMRIFDGANPEFPSERLSRVLDDAGWYGAQLAFKDQALEAAGRQEVVDAAEGGPRPRGRVWRRFLRVLDAGLQSLSAVPGVEPVLELKDFVEASQSE